MDVTLSANIAKALANYKDAPRSYIGASSIGSECLRQIWYQYHGINSDVSPQLQISFDIGKNLEGLILDYLERTNIEVIRPCEDNSYLYVHSDSLPEFAGHMDAIIVLPNSGARAVIDIKTAKSSSFQRFVNKGMRVWSERYYAQLQAYMGMSGIGNAVLLALNKDTSEMHEEWIEFDEIYYAELEAKASMIHKHEEPPAKINRSPLFYLCRMCGFRDVCHAGD